jgi:hypothetical protein
MNFKIAFVGAALMVFGGIFTVGCGGNDCEAAGEQIAAKFETCGGKVTTSDTSGGSAECSEAAGTLALCSAGCFEAADCSIIVPDAAKPPTADQVKAYTDCAAKCK